ncbi:MAG: hypothetical protein WCO75_02855, partial [Planctomycetota bacterium]
VPLGKEFLQGIEGAIEEALDDAEDELNVDNDEPAAKDRDATKGVTGKDAGAGDAGTGDVSAKDVSAKDVIAKDVSAKDVSADIAGADDAGIKKVNSAGIDAADANDAGGDLPDGTEPKRKSRMPNPDRKPPRLRRLPREDGELPPTPPPATEPS